MARRGSYPHPVVDAADDVDSDFEVHNVLVDFSQQDIEITYEVRTDDPDLILLLEAGAACHSLRWRCSATISTGEMNPVLHKRTAAGWELRAWLDQANVRGDVVAEVRVLVKDYRGGHSWQRQHPDYGRATFDLSPGDVLAEGGRIAFNVKKLFDPLDPPLGSCFRFLRHDTTRKGIRVSYDNDQTVDVRIPKETFDEFKQLGHRPDVQIALIVLPALMETLSFIKSNTVSNLGEDLSGRTWYETIDRMAREKGGWEQPTIQLAQRMLEHPLDRTIRSGIFHEDDE